MTAHRPYDDFHPIRIAESLQELHWVELDQVAPQIIMRMQTVAEAPGAPTGGRVSSGKPTGNAPRGETSLVDRHRPDIEAAILADLNDHDHGQEPRRYRQAVLRAAIGLYEARYGSLRAPGIPEAGTIDLEREERIATGYTGLPADVVAQLETAQGGWVLASAVRACRKRNERHPETGALDQRPRAELVDEAYRLRYEPDGQGRQRSYADIGRLLGYAPSTVMRWLRATDEAAA